MGCLLLYVSWTLVLCGCKTRSLAVSEQNNYVRRRSQRRGPGTNRGELPGEWGKLRSEVLHVLYYSSSNQVGGARSTHVNKSIDKALAVTIMGTGSLSLRKSGRGVTLTTHPHLAPRLKKEETYTSTRPLGLRGLF